MSEMKNLIHESCVNVVNRNVIWLADTNYRIDLDNASVRSLAERDDYDPLVAADQVFYNLYDLYVCSTVFNNAFTLAATSDEYESCIFRI